MDFYDDIKKGLMKEGVETIKNRRNYLQLGETHSSLAGLGELFAWSQISWNNVAKILELCFRESLSLESSEYCGAEKERGAWIQK